ncbi:PIN domain-containing protein [Candidatus Solincola sp.]|jgi:predicted nucleic acid-binding protein|nr:PIN domain-containing protein [Actinomycetota bacterium]MDI7253397.1 PIN domain-containing protein [Actinomycetota bacterium]
MRGAEAERGKSRAFLEGNVFFSGLHSRDEAPGRILEAAAAGKFRPVVSRQVPDGVVRVIGQKLPEALPLLREYLENVPLEVCMDLHPAEVEEWVDVVGGDDAPIAAAAREAEVDFLVSGDRHFLEAKSRAGKRGLSILSPSDFLRSL